VYLPSGGEVETIITNDEQIIKLYYAGFHLLTVYDQGGRYWSEVTRAGTEIEAERAQELLLEASIYLPLSSASADGCQNVLASKADENAKCEAIGLGAGVLGGLACGLICGAAAATLGLAPGPRPRIPSTPRDRRLVACGR
jgi:hypothetical protein